MMVMTKDTRNNLIFLAVLIPLLIPGAVMLFRAKLDPEAKRMFQPDATRHESVYINYDDRRPNQPRIVPPATGQWVQFESSQLVDPNTRRHLQWQTGAASVDRRFEVTGVSSSEDAGSLVVAVVWDERVVEPRFELDGQAMSITGQFTWRLPPQIGKELRKAGFVLPPEAIKAYLLQSDSPAWGRTLSVHFQHNDQAMQDQIVLTPSANAGSPR